MPKSPRIESALFGTFIIDGNKYEGDIVVSWNGEVRDRQKTHDFTGSEMNGILMSQPDVVVVGTGYSNMLKVAHDAEVAARLEGVDVVVKKTTDAVQEYNKLARLGKKVVAVLHSTC
jgi:hypothetical protein